MRRVLQINDYPSEILGGAEHMMGRTVSILGKAGCEVDTFTQANLSDTRLTALRYVSNLEACRALRKKLDKFMPEIVHLHNYYHVLSPALLSVLRQYKKRDNAAVVMTVHDYHLVCPNPGGNWFQDGLRNFDPDRLSSWRYLLSRRWDHRGHAHSLLRLIQHVWHYRFRSARNTVDLCLCPSEFMRKLIDETGMPTLLLPLPNPPFLSSPASRPNQLTIVFAGRIEPEKGLNFFVENWPSDANAKLIIVGEGSERSKVQETVQRRGLTNSVIFMGRLQHDETMQQIASAHVLIQPSLLFENYPLSLIEALSVGTNVLVADYGGMREMVHDSGVGFVFDPNQPKSLSMVWEDVLAEFREGTLNSFDVSQFLSRRSEQAYRDKLEALYDELLS